MPLRVVLDEGGGLPRATRVREHEHAVVEQLVTVLSSFPTRRLLPTGGAQRPSHAAQPRQFERGEWPGSQEHPWGLLVTVNRVAENRQQRGNAAVHHGAIDPSDTEPKRPARRLAPNSARLRDADRSTLASAESFITQSPMLRDIGTRGST